MSTISVVNWYMYIKFMAPKKIIYKCKEKKTQNIYDKYCINNHKEINIK